MKNVPEDLTNILDSGISGYHRYRLGENPWPVYISGNLCGMLGLSREELFEEGRDLYAARVHSGDRAEYEQFLRTAGAAEGRFSAQYRLVKRDGMVLYVQDSMTTSLQNGITMGESVLTDVTALKQENQNLRFLNETIPCGFLRYTCDKTPRLTFVNDRMKQILGFPLQAEEGFDPLELYRENIYLMIPMEERKRFSVYLDRVRRSGAPIAGEMTVLRCDGTRAYLFGWVTKCINGQGEEEFQSACMDITQHHQIRKERETCRYLQALAEVYDKIFEYDLGNHTVKCLRGQNSPMFRWIENIPMQMEEATEKWIMATVFAEDREAVRRFFEAFCRQQFDECDTPPVIRYRALSSNGILRAYTGIFVKIEKNVSLFCCRAVQDTEEADTLRSENSSLRGINENMQKLVMQFTDGLAAFEIVGDMVTPLYASDNVCGFFGFTREQWLSVMKKRTPIRDFVSNSKAAYEDFLVLLEKGEAEFSYFDLAGKRQRRIKAICSQKSRTGTDPRYVMLYNLEEEPGKAELESGVYLRTFGYFDVFVNEKPIAFRNEKSKELFALLTDRRGGFVSSEEAISYLWEEESANPVTLARYRKVALRLKNLLEEYGVSDIVESVNGKRRIVTEKVRCDLYDYLSGREEYAQLFKGSYLTNYSWAESTLAELSGSHIQASDG